MAAIGCARARRPSVCASTQRGAGAKYHSSATGATVELASARYPGTTVALVDHAGFVARLPRDATSWTPGSAAAAARPVTREASDGQAVHISRYAFPSSGSIGSTCALPDRAHERRTRTLRAAELAEAASQVETFASTADVGRAVAGRVAAARRPSVHRVDVWTGRSARTARRGRRPHSRAPARSRCASLDRDVVMNRSSWRPTRLAHPGVAGAFDLVRQMKPRTIDRRTAIGSGSILVVAISRDSDPCPRAAGCDRPTDRRPVQDRIPGPPAWARPNGCALERVGRTPEAPERRARLPRRAGRRRTRPLPRRRGSWYWGVPRRAPPPRRGASLGARAREQVLHRVVPLVAAVFEVAVALLARDGIRGVWRT